MYNVYASYHEKIVTNKKLDGMTLLSRHRTLDRALWRSGEVDVVFDEDLKTEVCHYFGCFDGDEGTLTFAKIEQND